MTWSEAIKPQGGIELTMLDNSEFSGEMEVG